MRAQLVCRTATGERLAFELGAGEALLGRDAGSTVRLPLDGVSRRHAVIEWDGKNHWIRDMKSTNGTFVNGERAHRERLRHLDVIGLGKTAEVVFLVRAEKAEAPVKRQGILRAALVPEAGDGLPIELAIGEVTLGRSAACNVVAGDPAVSKFHARIERGAERVILTDLGSANGTRVNGREARVATLRDGDVVSLAGAENYRVEIETGELEVAGAAREAPAAPPAEPAGPAFSAEWKTRLEWDTAEMEALQRKLAGHAASGAVAAGVEGTVRVAAARPAVQPPAHSPARPAPAAAPPRTAAPTAPPASPASPRTPTPEPRPRPAPPAPAAKPPMRDEPPPVRPQTPPAAPPAAPPAPAPAAPAPARPTPPPPPAAPAAPAPGAAAPTIREILLEGEAGTLRVSEPGRHLLGRSREAALRVDHPTVHRKHAWIVLSEDRRGASVEDLGGTNGTFVGGVRVGQAPLADGDAVVFGEARIRVRLVRG